MRQIFPGSFEPTRSEMFEVWKESTFILDSSFFLSLYSRKAGEMDMVLTLLDTYRDQLWVPHQAAQTYLNRCPCIIREKIDECYEFRESFDGQVELLLGQLRETGNPAIGDLYECLDVLQHGLEDFRSSIDRKRREYTGKAKRIITILSGIFDEEKIGPATPYPEVERLQEEAARRNALHLPPFIHEEETGLKRYDAVLEWAQVLAKVRMEMKPAFFITAGYPADWWRRADGKTWSIRSELINEFHDSLSVFFRIIDIETFIEVSQEITVERSVVRDYIFPEAECEPAS